MPYNILFVFPLKNNFHLLYPFLLPLKEKWDDEFKLLAFKTPRNIKLIVKLSKICWEKLFFYETKNAFLVSLHLKDVHLSKEINLK